MLEESKVVFRRQLEARYPIWIGARTPCAHRRESRLRWEGPISPLLCVDLGQVHCRQFGVILPCNRRALWPLQCSCRVQAQQRSLPRDWCHSLNAQIAHPPHHVGSSSPTTKARQAWAAFPRSPTKILGAKSKLLPDVYVSRPSAARCAAGCAGGGAIRCDRASFNFCPEIATHLARS